MPLVPNKYASAAACLRAWVYSLHHSDAQLVAAGMLGFYKDRVPQKGLYPCGRYFIEIFPDIWSHQRGGGYIETPGRVLVSFHSSKADDDARLATLYARSRQLLDAATGSNSYGDVVSCYYESDWEPGVGSQDGHEYSACGLYANVRIRRARLA